MKKIGIFAGVFDPIHLGHTAFIKSTVKDSSLDKVYVILEEEPKYKKCLADYSHRKKMTELAIADIPEAEIYESPAKFFPISASLPEIKKANPEAKLYLLVGDDVAEHISEWAGAEDLLKEVSLIVAKRDMEDPLSRASSLKIRQKINQEEVEGLEPKVLRYIQVNKLY